MMAEILMCVVNKIHCTHNKEGRCNFGEHCHPCVPECHGCNKMLSLNGTHYCAAYPLPEAQWRLGVCALASHTFVPDATKVRINPLKLARQRRRMGG